jgi:hypothetical protein
MFGKTGFDFRFPVRSQISNLKSQIPADGAAAGGPK